MWEYMNNNDFNWEPKSVIGRAESALKRDFAEGRLVLDIIIRCVRLGNRRKKNRYLAPSHFSLAASFPEANSVILYTGGEESFSVCHI